MNTVEEHQAETVVDFYMAHRWIRCTCGWEGRSWKGELAGAEHGALAEWAAHVHVALGLAERTVREEDEGLTAREMDEERAADEEAEQAWREERP